MASRVLIGSPVRQKPNILKHFLESLKNLEKNSISVDYFFIDDNEDILSTNLLRDFSERATGKVIIVNGEKRDKYVCNENTHYWNEKLIWKVAEYKNKIIHYCQKRKYDYLFLVDSDLVLHPKTVEHLISTGKDIISEIFWTKWQPDSPELPQVWLYDQYSMIEMQRGENITREEADIRINSFLEKMRKPGVYEVGGLGACTLITRKALNKGVNFSEIYNISFWGEDRHFSIRAAALGFKLFVDTSYPAYHIYRPSDLEDVVGISTTIPLSKKNMIEIIGELIHKYFSCDYRIITGYEYFRYLSPKYVEKFSERQESIIDYLIKNKVRCETRLLKADINKADEEKVEAEVAFQVTSTKENTEKKDFSCRLILGKYDSRWLIDYISLKDNEGNSILGFCLADLLAGKKRINKDRDNKLTLMMLVRNEAGKFLESVLSHAARYVDNAVILDDGSEDNTVEVCEKVLKNIPHCIVSNERSGFHNEIVLRKQLWELTVKTNPDWILCLDADEIFEDSIIYSIRQLINQPEFDYYSFRLYDMWDEFHYREDRYWQAHRFYRIFLIRYQPDFDYVWNETPQHCGRFPKNIHLLEGCQYNIRLKHYGWANEALRTEKYKRYMELDPEGKYGSLNQYRTILDPKPTLIKWE